MFVVVSSGSRERERERRSTKRGGTRSGIKQRQECQPTARHAKVTLVVTGTQSRVDANQIASELF